MGYTHASEMGAGMVEEKALAELRRLEARRTAGKILLALGGVTVFGALTRFIPGDPGDVGLARIGIFAAAAAVLLAAGLALLLGARIPADARTGRLALIRAEGLQARRHTAFLLMPLSLGLMLFGVVRATSVVVAGRALRHLDIFVLGCFVFFVMAFGLLIAGRGLDRWARPVLDDELSREIRGKALQLGYFILLPGLAALFVLGLYRPQLAIEVAPVLAALGVAGPAVRLFWLERAAGAGAPDA